MAVGDDKIADFNGRQLRSPQAELSAEKTSFCSEPYRYRFFFNLKVLSPKSSQIFSYRL